MHQQRGTAQHSSSVLAGTHADAAAQQRLSAQRMAVLLQRGGQR
jgi:hypothetical protein